MSTAEERAEQMMQGLAGVKRRLETLPLGSPDGRMLKDCMVALIRIIAGEEVDQFQVGPRSVNSDPSEHTVTVGGQALRGGIETSPGVVQYFAPGQTVMPEDVPKGPALIDVKAGLAAAGGHPQPRRSGGVIPELPSPPLPGSMAAQALGLPPGVPQSKEPYEPPQVTSQPLPAEAPSQPPSGDGEAISDKASGQ